MYLKEIMSLIDKLELEVSEKTDEAKSGVVKELLEKAYDYLDNAWTALYYAQNEADYDERLEEDYGNVDYDREGLKTYARV